MGSERLGVSPPGRWDERSLWQNWQRGERPASSPLLRHSSHDLSCSTLRRDTSSRPQASDLGRAVAERRLQKFSGELGQRASHQRRRRGTEEQKRSAVRREVITGPCLSPHWCVLLPQRLEYRAAAVTAGKIVYVPLFAYVLGEVCRGNTLPDICIISA